MIRGSLISRQKLAMTKREYERSGIDFFHDKTNDEVFEKMEYEGGPMEYIFGYSSPSALQEPYRAAATLLLDIIDEYDDWQYAQPEEEELEDEEPLYGADADA
jgi:hypothetical protein